MRVILFGGTGMVGQGVLRECVKDAGVEKVLLVVRKASGLAGGKVEEMVHGDFYDWAGSEQRFEGYDACFFCLGVSSFRMKEPEYRRVTFDLTMKVAEALAKTGSMKTFVYVSGQSTDANGKQMWARVKGATENALMAMPFAQVFCFRPGMIEPKDGIRSKTAVYQFFLSAFGWLFPLLHRMFPWSVTDTAEIGRAMIAVTRGGWACRVLETRDIHAAGRVG